MTQATFLANTSYVSEEHIEQLIRDRPRRGKDDLAVVAIGLTGVGKSTFLNFLMKNHSRFPAKAGQVSCTDTVTRDEVHLRGQSRLAIIDTPGILDTMAFSGRTDENSCQLLLDQCQDFMKHLHSAVNLAGEHIDAFLLVINVNKRFTRESSFLIDALEEIGIEYDHIVVVFTEAGAHGKTQEERKKNVSKMLDRPETRQCGLKKLIEDVNER